MFESMVRKEVIKAVNIAKEAYPQAFLRVPNVEFSRRMTKTCGLCIYKKDVGYTVRFSLSIMELNDISAYISQVVYHEVAHMVDRQVYGNWGHGNTFYRIMREVYGKLGAEAERTHSFKTKPSKPRTVKKYYYKCPTCGKMFQLTTIRHNRAQNGTRYSHKGHDPLQYIIHIKS